MVSVVCVLCELGHVRKKRRRLADEKPHASEECESTHGGAFRVRRSNDRNNRKTRVQERARLRHDQVLFQEWIADVQIRKRHRYPSHRIDYVRQWWRITCLIRPCLKMHGLGGAYTDQDSEDFRMGRPLCQRGVEAGATLLDGREVEACRVRDRL